MIKSIFKQIGLSFQPNKTVMAAFAFGVLAVFAFKPIGFAPIAIVSLMGVFWLWLRAESQFEGFKIGLWYGLGMFGVGVSWLISSIYLYGGVNLILAIVATLIFILFMALFIGLGGWLARFFVKENKTGFVLIVLFPAVWVLMEWVRSTLFGGFPFLLMGTNHLGTWLDGYAPLLGVLGVSWAMAMTAGLLLWIGIQKAWMCASCLMALIWLTGAGLQQVEWVTPKGQPVKIGLIQGNIPQEKKWLNNQYIPSMKTYINLTKQALNSDAKVIVWPETAIPDYYDRAKSGLLKQFIADAQLLNSDILVGTIVRDVEKDEYYNAVVNLKDESHPYLKHHLVPFSEYFPFSTLLNELSKLFNIPFSSFAAGDIKQPLMKVGINQVGISVCYEMAFGEELANQLPEANYLITVSNDAWFAHTLEPAQQLQEVQMRALELGREIARSTNTGFTAIVGIKGNLKSQIPPYKATALISKIQPYQGSTFFAEWKQLPILFLLSLIFGFMLTKHIILKR